MVLINSQHVRIYVRKRLVLGTGCCFRVEGLVGFECVAVGLPDGFMISNSAKYRYYPDNYHT